MEHSDGLYVFEGFYEYTAKFTDQGNSVTGRLAGKNKVKFYNDSSCIEFEYPSMKISGLTYGRRTTQWLGTFEFSDRENGIHAKLEFSQGAGFFNREALPLDCFEGTLKVKGVEHSTI